MTFHPKTTCRTKRRDYSGYLYILPATLFILVFAIVPICMAFYYSLTQFNVIQDPTWIGWKNYLSILDDPYVLAALKNTILYVALTVPLTTMVSMMLAALITSRKRTFFIGVVKSSMFVPVICSAILAGTLWRIMYNAEFGLINQFLNLLGIDSVNWLGTSSLALPSVALVGIWRDAGYFMVIYIAGIMDIPHDLYEAASIDGATGWQQFRYITLPLLKHTTFMVVILCTIRSFQVFDVVYTMTGGGPGTSTITLVYIIYNSAFRDYRMGYACALAMVLFVIILLFSMLQRVLLQDPKGGE